MILGIMYLIIGGIIGFLVKHEIDIKQKRSRINKKIGIVSKASMIAPCNDTLSMVKELNETLLLIQEGQQRKKEVRL